MTEIICSSCGHSAGKHDHEGCMWTDYPQDDPNYTLRTTCTCHLSRATVEARYWARVMKERWEDAEKRVSVLVALIDRMDGDA